MTKQERIEQEAQKAIIDAKIKEVILTKYNIMAKEIYSEFYTNYDPSQLRLLILSTISEHIITKTIDTIESKDKSIAKKLDKLLYMQEHNKVEVDEI